MTDPQNDAKENAFDALDRLYDENDECLRRLAMDERKELRRKKEQKELKRSLKMNETYEIIYDFNEWVNPAGDYCPVSANLVEYVRPLKNYFDGFLAAPVAMHEGQVITAKSVKSNTFNLHEVVEFFKDLKKNNKMVFLYQIKEGIYGYYIRYGVLE